LSREAVVAEAMTWEGTPYHSGASIKGVGVDCAMFPAAVYHAVGLTPKIEPKYSPDWMMHRDEETFLAWVTPYAREITRDALGPGDFVIWKFGRTYSHGAIVIAPPIVLHAVQEGRAVIRGNMDRDEDLRSRSARYFTLWG